MPSTVPVPREYSEGPGSRRGRELLEAFLRRPLLVCVPAALVALSALSAAVLLPQRYRATALVRADWESEGGAADRAAIVSRRQDAVRQQVLARPTIERVLREVSAHPSGSGIHVPSSGGLEAMQAAVGVEPRGADVFAITYVYGEPATAALVSNSVAHVLIEQMDERREASPANLSLLDARLVDARKAMGDALAALRAGKQTGSTPASSGEDPAFVAREALEVEQRAVAASLSAARASRDRLRRTIDDEKSPPTEDGASPELLRLRAELGELRRRYTEEHPDVEALVRRIRRLESEGRPTPPPELAAGADALEKQLGEVDAEIEDLSREKDRLNAQIAELGARATTGSAPGRQKDLRALTGDFEQARTAYLSLQEERAAAERAGQLSRGVSPRLEILEEAHVPESPYFPNRLLFGLVGLGLGLSLGLSAALVAERRDQSVKGPEDLEDLLQRPLLAVISLVRVSRSSRRG